MYEKMTYESILQKMLNMVSDDVDKREGSIIYDALAPAAYFLADQFFQLDNFVDLLLPDTALGEYLDRAVGGYGITRKEASAAIRKVTTSAAVPIGSRWSIEGIVYRIADQTAENEYEAECETAGKIGNTYSGPLEALTAVNGVTAELTELSRMEPIKRLMRLSESGSLKRCNSRQQREMLTSTASGRWKSPVWGMQKYFRLIPAPARSAF